MGSEPVSRLPPPATLAHKNRTKCEWNGKREPQFKVQTDGMQMPRVPCSKITRTAHACTQYIPVEIRNGEKKEQCCILTLPGTSTVVCPF